MNLSEAAMAATVRVFISYSHDSREHCDQVLAFAQQLRRDGIDAELD
jgi:SEFIR domain